MALTSASCHLVQSLTDEEDGGEDPTARPPGEQGGRQLDGVEHDRHSKPQVRGRRKPPCCGKTGGKERAVAAVNGSQTVGQTTHTKPAGHLGRQESVGLGDQPRNTNQCKPAKGTVGRMGRRRVVMQPDALSRRPE